MEDLKNNTIKGGEFLVRTTEAGEIFIPEEYTEEQIMIAQTCHDFLEQNVNHQLDEIDEQQEGLMESLVEKAGELGLLGVSIPEEFGGFGKDINTGLLVNEATGAGHSFAVAVAAHTGIGTLPILYYGTQEQKEKYLPKLSAGEFKGAYCLTEPGSGSDANAAKTKAVLTEDGKHYILNGQKMWITNAGFADVFIVFARIDDDKNISGFIVEKDFGGITLNEEEKKMGIKGSSTRQVFFNDCKVPVENLLGKRDGGFKIAVNILNIGRIKLAAAALGAAKGAANLSIKYANERQQFGRSISKYGAIRYKIAEQAIKIYATESATYRAGKDMDMATEKYKGEGKTLEEAKLKAAEEFAVECAILKVHGSETLDYVVDEGVQIYGGMGFSADAPMDRSYRDSRINRIFEGTNEINRMLAVDMMLRKGLKGEIDLMGPVQAVIAELTSVPDFGGDEEETLFSKEKKIIANMKKVGLMVAGASVQKYTETLAKEQEVLMDLADILIEAYVAESSILRAEKLVSIKGEEAAKMHIEMAKVNLYDANDRIYISAKNAINSFAEGDEMRMMLLGLKRYTKHHPLNVKELRRSIAQKLIDQNKFGF
ncbi:MAG: alkylation response protein AidB-like acyl-CoA dehydrogenase [Sphingobacteriales bacterium]|jgi:alkylation response protein AidB-like acyl-CoA dehydrogenase